MARISLRTQWPFIIILMGALLVIATFYLPDILFSDPSGIHFIRQTDSLAFIGHFRTYSANLFTPGVFDLRNAPADGSCAGEFPLIYWVIGMAERLIGDAPLLLKWTNLTLVMTGHVLFIGAMSRILGGRMLASAIGLLMFGSGVVAYYACNYLPDAGVYGLVLCGWSLILPDLFNGRYRPGMTAICVFVLAGMIKAPAAMHLVALVIIGAWPTKATSRNRTAAMYIGIVCIVAWHAYANVYNNMYGSHYFMTWAEPLWAADAEERSIVSDLVLNYWWSKYLHPSTWHVLMVMGGLIIWRSRSIPRMAAHLLALLVLACMAFVVLFFRKLADHDYYFLTIMPAISLYMLIGIRALLELNGTTWWRRGVTAGTWGLAISAALLAHTEVQRRASRAVDGYSRTGALTKGLRETMRKDPLPRDARVIVLGDSTTNGALTALGRAGWSHPGYPITAEPDLKKLIDTGATHVLLVGTSLPSSLNTTHVAGEADWSLWHITRP